MDDNDKIKKRQRWGEKGFDEFLSREPKKGPTENEFIGGAQFDASLDEMTFNRIIKLKDLREKPQGNDPGKIYWDGENKKYKIWIDETGQWADVIYTSTSTSTSTTSSSSTSTSTTSSSSSSSSTSTTSSSSSTSSTSTS